MKLKFKLPSFDGRLSAKFSKFKWTWKLKKSNPREIESLETDYYYDDAEIIRVYTKRKNASQAVDPSHQKKISETITNRQPCCSTKELALLYPILIPQETAWSNFKHAIQTINREKDYKLLKLTSLEHQTITFLCKSGMWGSSKTRMFFAKTIPIDFDGSMDTIASQNIRRFFIETTTSGYPGVYEKTGQPLFETRIISLEDVPHTYTVSDTKPIRVQPLKTLEPISPSGQLPLWAKDLLTVYKDYKHFMDKHESSEKISLIEIMDTSHAAACDILDLDKTQKNLLRNEVKSAYKHRLNIIHPDKMVGHDLDTTKIAQALGWAKSFLSPL